MSNILEKGDSRFDSVVFRGTPTKAAFLHGWPATLKHVGQLFHQIEICKGYYIFPLMSDHV
jgi:hypothetical protein